MPDRELPTFEELMDGAELTREQRIELLLLIRFDPVAAGIKIGGILLGQKLAASKLAERLKEERM